MSRLLASHRAGRRSRGGYAMLVALVLIAIIAIIGASSLQVAGVDQRVALHDQRHLVALNTADAGTVHARKLLEEELPANEGWDTADTGGLFLTAADGDAEFEGTSFPVAQGVYEVDAVFQKCSNPPPGYSTEYGPVAYHSQFWDMRSRGTFRDTALVENNPTRATVVATLRKVVQGDCKIR